MKQLRVAMLDMYRKHAGLEAKLRHEHNIRQQITEQHQKRATESANKIMRMTNNYKSMETGYNCRIRELMASRAALNTVLRQTEGKISTLKTELEIMGGRERNIRKQMQKEVMHFEQKYRECVAQQHHQQKEHETLIQQHNELRVEMAKLHSQRDAPRDESRYQALTNALKKVLAEFGSPEDRPMFKAMSAARDCGRAMLFEALKRSECAVCYSNQSNSVINPCGHCAVCTECIKRLNKCPICRVKITSWVRIYV